MNDFQQFGISHVVVLLVVLVLTIVAQGISRLPEKVQTYLAKTFGWLLLISFPVYQFYQIFILQVWEVRYHLMLNVSNFIFLWMGLAFLRKERIWSTLSFFWALPAGVISMLIPDLNHEFPSAYFFFFWINHAAMLILISFILQYRAVKIVYRDIWVAVAVLVLYAMIVYPINQWAGANYGYLIDRPPSFPVPENGIFATQLGYIGYLLALAVGLFHGTYAIVLFWRQCITHWYRSTFKIEKKITPLQ